MAINKLHARNKDKFLDKGGVNESNAADVKSTVDLKHIQNTDIKLDEGGANELTASETRAFIDSKGQNNGLATLDASGKVPSGELPASLLGSLIFKGTWNATTNTPTLGDLGVGGVQGDYFVVSVLGTTSIDGNADWEIGDWLVHNGSTWDKIDNSDKVASINGAVGVVVLDTSDISENTNLYYTEVRVSANADVIANTAKISYTDAAAVALNTAKISYTDAAAVALNTAARNNATTIQGKVIDAPVAGDDGKAVTYDLTLDKYIYTTIPDDTAIYAQLSSSVDQNPTDTNPTVITFNTQDAINGITHSTTVNPGEITIDTAGVYFVSPQPQVGLTSGSLTTFDMFLQVDRGSGFADEANSNIKLTLDTADITDVIILAFTILLNVGDKIRMMQRVSNSLVGMGIKNTNPEVGPPTVPRTPSIIFTMHRVGG